MGLHMLFLRVLRAARGAPAAVLPLILPARELFWEDLRKNSPLNFPRGVNRHSINVRRTLSMTCNHTAHQSKEKRAPKREVLLPFSSLSSNLQAPWAGEQTRRKKKATQEKAFKARFPGTLCESKAKSKLKDISCCRKGSLCL